MALLNLLKVLWLSKRNVHRNLVITGAVKDEGVIYVYRAELFDTFDYDYGRLENGHDQGSSTASAEATRGVEVQATFCSIAPFSGIIWPIDRFRGVA